MELEERLGERVSTPGDRWHSDHDSLYSYSTNHWRPTMTLLGLLAGACTTVSFLPQVVRTFRTGSAKDMSWGWLSLFGAGVGGWLAYGLVGRDVAIIVANATTLA